MKAVTVQHRSDPHLVLSDVAEPPQGEGDALVAVSRIALNPGELRYLAMVPNGARIGWDFAGTVIKPAPNGRGPKEGARVVGTTRSGGWVERIAASIEMLAVVPDDLELEIAVCLPVPAMTAYVGLRYAGLLFGKHVLVTGAAGAVGQFACQLALESGARVSAAVRREGQVAQVTSHGVIDVRVTDGIAAFRDDHGRFDLILDSIGPGVSEEAAALLAPGGVYAVMSAAGGNVLTLPIPQMLSAAGQLRVINLFTDIARGPDSGGEMLGRLVAAAAAGAITAPLGPRGSWTDIDRIARAYLAADDRAKPVLTVGGGPS